MFQGVVRSREVKERSAYLIVGKFGDLRRVVLGLKLLATGEPRSIGPTEE